MTEIMCFLLLVLFGLGSVGITLIVTEGSITKGLRQRAMNIHPKLGELVSCPQCASTWIGAILGAYFLTLVNNGFCRLIEIPLIFVFAGASSFLSMLGKAIIFYLNFGTDIPLEDLNEENS